MAKVRGFTVGSSWPAIDGSARGRTRAIPLFRPSEAPGVRPFRMGGWDALAWERAAARPLPDPERARARSGRVRVALGVLRLGVACSAPTASRREPARFRLRARELARSARLERRRAAYVGRVAAGLHAGAK